MRLTLSPRDSKSTALVYLARGAEADHLSRFECFLTSYRNFSAGIDHTLHVVFKGFESDARLEAARRLFAPCRATEIFVDDTGLDLGAYAEALPQILQDRVCFLNTNSEILCHGWLGKLAVNLDQPRVGIVSATASFESLALLDPRFPRFPNAHVRSNAFMMARDVALQILPAFHINDKIDAYFAESGPESITRRVFAMGMMALLVGRNGRGYDPVSWPASATFRQGTQDNLLVHDNVTRVYDASTWLEKKSLADSTWGEYLRRDKMMVLPS